VEIRFDPDDSSFSVYGGVVSGELGDIEIETKDAHYLCRQFAKIRTVKGLTRGEVADMIGCDVSYITNIENGTKKPTLLKLQKLCLAIDARLEIVGWEPWEKHR